LLKQGDAKEPQDTGERFSGFWMWPGNAALAMRSAALEFSFSELNVYINASKQKFLGVFWDGAGSVGIECVPLYKKITLRAALKSLCRICEIWMRSACVEGGFREMSSILLGNDVVVICRY